MISDKQLEANRANAQKSTGPTTEEGKRRSSLNAYRHGLTGQTLVMPEEEMAAYNKFAEETLASLDIGAPMERQLATIYSTFLWRINKAAAIEENLFTLGNIKGNAENLQLEDPRVHNALSQAMTYARDPQAFARMSMYSQRLVNQADKMLSQLKYLQAERRQREHREMQEAVSVYKAHRLAGEPFDPKADGFVLTLPQIELYLRRQHLQNADFIADEAARKRKKAA